MEYSITPFGELWKDGIFTVPNQLVDKYLRLTSEYQLKALLFILRNDCHATDEQIAEALKLDMASVGDIVEFWCDEGILAVNGEAEKAVAVVPKESVSSKSEKEEKKSSPPRLSRDDIVNQLKSSKLLPQLVNQAQQVLCRPLTDVELESIVNMVNYYGLPVEVILMILEYYRSETHRGIKLGFSYIETMARNWADEGIETVEEADEKLHRIEQGNRRWNEVIAIAGIKRKRPTDKQRETVNAWFDYFDISMITLAADIMKQADEVTPSVQYMDKILQKWKKLDISSTEKALEYQESLKSRNKPDNRIKRNPSYDMEEITRRAMENTDIV